MPSLAFCLKKLGIKGAEADYLTQRTKAYVSSSGMSQAEADSTVLNEWIKELEREYGSILDQVQEATLKAPKEERRKYDAYTKQIWESMIDKVASVREAREIMRELLRKVYTDNLTGIGSRAGFFEQVAQDEKLPVNQRRNIVLIDLDNFSFFNDILGHGTGDEVLKKVGKALEKFGIEPYRIGGEEFALLVKNDQQAAQAAMNIQEALEEQLIVRQKLREPRRLSEEDKPYAAGEDLTIEGVGVSYGIDKIYKRADEKLQNEKSSREKEGLRAKKGTEIKRLRRRRPSEAGEYAERERLRREGIFTQFSVAKQPSYSEALRNKWKEQGVKVDIYEGNDKIDLQMIEVPKPKRKRGIGTEVMNELIEHADSVGKRIELTPGQKDDVHGTTSRSRLVKFYKRFGFVENKGRNKDFTTVAGMYRQPLVNRISALPPLSAAFKKWFGKSVIVDEGGNPLIVFHGSTHNDITVYRTNDDRYVDDLAGYDNYMGPGAYFSNSILDVNKNYAGIGQDLKNKIGQFIDKFEDIDRQAQAEILIDFFQKNSMEGELKLVQEFLEIQPTSEDYENFDVLAGLHWEGAVEAFANEQLVGEAEGGVMYPVYIKMENPFDMDNTLIPYETTWDEETGELLEEGGPAEGFITALIQEILPFETDGMITDLRNELYQEAMDWDGLTGKAVLEAMQRTLYSIYDADTGVYIANGAIVRRVVEQMGYDGLILNAWTHFGPKKLDSAYTTPGMPGVNPDTRHYLPFKPNQIKSAIGNVGTFDPNSDDISFSVKHGYGKQLELPFKKQKNEKYKKGMNFPYYQVVEVNFNNMEPFRDAIAGWNQFNALARARANWVGAEIVPIGDLVPRDAFHVDEIIDQRIDEIDYSAMVDAAHPETYLSVQRLAEKKWPDVPFEETRFHYVNNRMSKELYLFELLFGESAKAITVPGREQKPARGIIPSDLLQELYRVVESGEAADLLNRKHDPMEIAVSRGFSKRSPGKLPSGKRMRSPAEDFVHFLNKVRRTSLLMPVDEDAKPILTDNSKAGASADLLLAFCDPTEQCMVCYAAKSMIREDVWVKAFRNSLHLLSDPDGYANQIAQEASALRLPDFPFIRLLGSGDFVTIEQVKAYNKLAKTADRPIHIFSRHHEMLRRLKGNSTAPFLSMGSVDATLYDIYGHDFLVENMQKFGIANAWLYLHTNELAKIDALNADNALGLVLASIPELHVSLPPELRQRSCPCDAEIRSHLGSCRQCAMSYMGCMTAFQEMAVDSKGKMWRFDAPDRPKKLWPVLGYAQDQDKMSISDFVMLKRDGTIKSRKEFVQRAKRELEVDPDLTMISANAQGYLSSAIQMIRKSLKDTRKQIKKIEALPKGDKRTYTLPNYRFPADSVETNSVELAQAHLEGLQYQLDQAYMAKTYLVGDEITQRPVAIKNGQILPDATTLTPQEAADLSFSVASRANDVLFKPEDIENANRTAAVGAVGAKAKVPRYIQQIAKTGDRILDFGAGVPNKDGVLRHAEALRKKGFEVTAYEFGDNADPAVHDAKALEKRYDIVYGSNVLNIQNSPSMFDTTLKQMIQATTRKGGQLVVNMPSGPRKGFLARLSHPKALKYVRQRLNEKFAHVENASFNGKIDREIFVASGKRPIDLSVQRSSKKVTQDPNFKKWFGGSKITNEDGSPKIVYHGTWKPDFNAFRTDIDFLGDVTVFPTGLISFSFEPEFANRWLGYWDTILPDQARAVGEATVQGREKADRLYPVYLKVENPFDFRNDEHVQIMLDDYRKNLEADPVRQMILSIDDEAYVERHVKGQEKRIREGDWDTLEQPGFLARNGFDGVYTMERGYLTISVLDPKQIKSIYNRGTYNAATPDIRLSTAVSGWQRQMNNVLEKKLPGKGSAQQMLKTVQALANKGEFKKEELEWSGLIEYLEDLSRHEDIVDPLFPKRKPIISVVKKADILAFLTDEARIVVDEVVHGSLGMKEISDSDLQDIPPEDPGGRYIREDAWEGYIEYEYGEILREYEDEGLITDAESREFSHRIDQARARYIEDGDEYYIEKINEDLRDLNEDEDGNEKLTDIYLPVPDWSEESARDNYMEYRAERIQEVADELGIDPEEVEEGIVPQVATQYGQYTLVHDVTGHEPGADYHELIVTLESTPQNIKATDLDRKIHKAKREIRRQESTFEDYTYAHKLNKPIDEEWRERIIRAAQKHAEWQATLEWLQEQRQNLGEVAAPAIEEYEHAHWDDVKNPLFHVRFTDQKTVDGQDVLFIEEVQSDWHQQGRKRGYRTHIVTDAELEAAKEKYDQEWEALLGRAYLDDRYTNKRWENLTLAQQRRYVRDNRESGGKEVSDAPFKKSWQTLAIKRILRWAVEHGYDRIAWSSGAIQERRYPSIRDYVHDMKVERKAKGDKTVYSVWAKLYSRTHYDSKGEVEENYRFVGDLMDYELSDHIGKEMADRVIADPMDKQSYAGTEFELGVGNLGMRKFYDSMLVNEFNKMFGKKSFGNSRVKVSRVVLPTQAHSYKYEKKDITDRATYTLQDVMAAIEPRIEAKGKNRERYFKTIMKRSVDEQGAAFGWGGSFTLEEKMEELEAQWSTEVDYVLSDEEATQGKWETIFKLAWDNGNVYEKNAMWDQLRVHAGGLVYKRENVIYGGKWGHQADASTFKFLGVMLPDTLYNQAVTDDAKAQELVDFLNDAEKNVAEPEVWYIDVTEQMREKAKDLPLFSVPPNKLAPARESAVMAEAMQGLDEKATLALNLRERGIPFFSDYVRRHGGEGVNVKALRKQYAQLYGAPVEVKLTDEETVQIGMKYASPVMGGEMMFSSPLKNDPQLRPLAEMYLEMIKATLPPVKVGEDMEINVFDELRPEVRARIEQKGGLQQPPFMDKAKALLVAGKNMMTRAYRHLDPNEYGALADVLRLHGEVGNTASRRATTALTNILHGLKPRQYGAFRMVIIMDDMIKDIDSGLLQPDFEAGQTFPFGFESVEEVKEYHKKVTEIAEGDELVSDALRRRQEFNNDLKQMLVDNGLLPESVLEDDRYFHHQVLLYRAVTSEGDEGYMGTGLGKRVQYRKKGWQMARKGSLQEYNTDYAQAEYEVFAQAFQQLETVATLKRVEALVDSRERIKEIAKAEGIENWKELAKELGYVAWKPAPNTAWYKASTITDKIIDQIQSGELAIEDAEFREVWMKGSDTEWWVKPEVAKTLDEYGKVAYDHNLAMKWSAHLQRTWKQFMLISPFRFFKYNMNNMSGDSDIAFAYRPGILRPKYLGRALIDIMRDYRQNGRVTWTSRVINKIVGRPKEHTEEVKAELELARRLGVIDSGWTIQELHQLSDKMEFEEAIKAFDENPGKIKALLGAAKYTVWGRQKNLTAARENLLRLAAWRYVKDKEAAGEKLYGASKRAEVDAVTDFNERTAKIARELIGDYGNISEGGQWLRRHMIPFYSWVEVNSPRYLRLMQNMKHEGASRAMLPVAVAWKGTKLAAKMVAFMTLVALWNRTFFPDEEDELPEQQRRQLHLILGRRKDGSIRTVRIQGAFSDMLAFVGAEDIFTDVRELVGGKKTMGEQAVEVPKAFATKVIHGLRPGPKYLFSMAMQRQLYPDPFKPRPVRDRIEETFRMWAMEKPYRFLAGKPRRGATPSERLLHDITSMVYYNSDPGEMANYQTIAWAHQFMEDIGEDTGGGFIPSPKSNVLYYYRQALRYGDLPAAQRYLEKYAKEFAGTPKGLRQSIKRAHPLTVIPSAKRGMFYSVLTPHQAKVVDMGIEWYHKVYRSQAAADIEAKLDWPPPKAVEPKTLNQIRLK